MKAGKRVGAICLVATLSLTASGRTALRAQTPVQGVELSARAASITGTVLDMDDRAIPGSHLRLRDVTSGRIVATTRGNEDGKFRFGGVPAGKYVVEIVDENSKLRGVSQTFTVKAGEALSAVVRIAGRRSWYSSFFSNAAVAAVSSAAALGITAVGNGMQPASGRF